MAIEREDSRVAKVKELSLRNNRAHSNSSQWIAVARHAG